MKTQSTKKTGGAQLLMQRRFGPLFWTQFCGAFNDNLFKNAIIFLATFGVGMAQDVDPKLLVPVAFVLLMVTAFLNTFLREANVWVYRGVMLLAPADMLLHNAVHLFMNDELRGGLRQRRRFGYAAFDDATGNAAHPRAAPYCRHDGRANSNPLI